MEHTLTCWTFLISSFQLAIPAWKLVLPYMCYSKIQWDFLQLKMFFRQSGFLLLRIQIPPFHLNIYGIRDILFYLYYVV